MHPLIVMTISFNCTPLLPYSLTLWTWILIIYMWWTFTSFRWKSVEKVHYLQVHKKAVYLTKGQIRDSSIVWQYNMERSQVAWTYIMRNFLREPTLTMSCNLGLLSSIKKVPIKSGDCLVQIIGRLSHLDSSDLIPIIIAFVWKYGSPNLKSLPIIE